MELKKYLENPCGLLSIPWWKHLRMTLPPHITILHHREYTPEAASGCREQVYFRLSRDLRNIPAFTVANIRLEQLSPDDAALTAAIINGSYEDIRVTESQVLAMQDSPAFCPQLWVLAREERSGEAAGCAMGEFDPESGEMSIEWVQVLPAFRRKGIGSALVSELLRRAPAGAAFVTVSGQADNAADPEGLYRRCGFTGRDYWHILRKEN